MADFIDNTGIPVPAAAVDTHTSVGTLGTVSMHDIAAREGQISVMTR